VTSAAAAADSIAFAGVAGQAAMLADGSLTSAALVERVLSRIDGLQPRLNAFRTVFATQARVAAEAADRARAAGDPRPLLGVPIAVKDNVHVRGHAAAFGTGSREPVATDDDELVARLRAAGLIVIGTTQLPELALWGVTESQWHGVTRNPWATGRAPGGSSGGSAAAVAAGIVAGAHATDGLGSIRIPASSCGLVGLKPTRGLVPLGPEPDHWCGLSHAGFLTRRVRDTALLLDAVLGSDYDGSLADRPRLRVAVSSSAPPWRVDPQVRAVLDATTQTLRDLGHDVTERDPAYGLNLANSNSVRYLRGVADDVRSLAEPDRLEPRTKALAAVGRRIPDRLVAWARREGDALAERMDAFFGSHDVLITPTVPRLPLPAGALLGRNLVATLRRMLPYAAFTQPWNGAGLPAVSIPAGWTGGGLPVGVQLVGPAYAESRLLGLAAELEDTLGWAARTPPII